MKLPQPSKASPKPSLPEPSQVQQPEFAKPQHPVVDTKIAQALNPEPSAKPSARSVKKAIPDGDLLLAELDAALLETVTTVSANPSSSKSPAWSNTPNDVKPWFGSTLNSSSNQHSQKESTQPAVSNKPPDGSIAHLSAQAAILAASKPPQSTSAITKDASIPKPSSKNSSTTDLHTTSRPSRIPATGPSPSHPSLPDISPRTQKDIETLADSIDALIRSKSKASSSSFDGLQPIQFEAGSSAMLASTEAVEEEDESRDAFGEGASPVRARESKKKRSGVTWSMKSVAKSLRQSFAGAPGMDQIALDLNEGDGEESESGEEGLSEDDLELEDEEDVEENLVDEVPVDTQSAKTSAMSLLASPAKTSTVSLMLPASAKTSTMSLLPAGKLSSSQTRSAFDIMVKEVEPHIEIQGTVHGQSCKFRVGDGRIHCIGERDKTDVDQFPFEFYRILACKEDGPKSILTGISSKKSKITSISIDFPDTKTALLWSKNVTRIVTKDHPESLFNKRAVVILDEREPTKVTRDAFQKDILPIMQASGKEFEVHTLPFTAVDLGKLFSKIGVEKINVVACISSRPRSKDVDDILAEMASKATGGMDKFKVLHNISEPLDIGLALVKEP
ncbi:hypothetical protein BC829DRAFT_69686 [Chytridium lagenaria]|nr:hypothetical protein BC829DRAFT_69686 [Chytridium lagenaria]